VERDSSSPPISRERERERERPVVSAITQSIQNGADVRNAQAGHLIVDGGTE